MVLPLTTGTPEDRGGRSREQTESDLRAAELDQLQADLAERELELATLRAELESFEFLYLRTLGLRYAELDGLEAEIAEFLAAAAPHDAKARDRAARARSQAQESEEATDWVGEPDDGEENRFVPSEDLKKLYRRVAKRVHPDLADDEDEREVREELMAEANRAYAEGDGERLREILEDWERTSTSDAEGTPDLGLERVMRRIDHARARLQAIAGELEELRGSELYLLHLKVEGGKRSGIDLLAEMSREVDRQIASARRRLRALKTGRDPWVEEFFAAAERGAAEGFDGEPSGSPGGQEDQGPPAL